MAREPVAVDTSTTASTTKKRRTRTTGAPKPAFVIVQVLDEAGQPMAFDKKRLKIVKVERSAEKVMEAMDTNEFANAFYLRVVVPAAPTIQRNKPVEVPAAA